jgi:DNA-binding LytR/AlgR family response regulator
METTASISLPKQYAEVNLSNEKNVLSVRFFKTGKAIYKVDISTIEYVIAAGNYSKLFMSNKQSLLIGLPLNEVEKMLCGKEFIRIHRSSIISVRSIEKVVDNIVYINKVNLAVGKTYRNLFYQRIMGF